MEDDWLSGLDERGQKCAQVVNDVDADARTCPACLHEYARGPVKCPACGLFLGA